MNLARPTPDEIIKDIGGCGRFQVAIGVTVHATKGLICFSIMSMILIAATPQWWCVSDVTYSNVTCIDGPNKTYHCYEKTCNVNSTKCTYFEFGRGVRTVVSEFELVCGLDYVPSTVMSMQTFGMLAGALIAGQISDLFGRKPPYFAGILCLTIFNFVGFMSVNWIMFAISRLFVGLGSGAFLAIQYCIVSEFSPARWRPCITGFPSWHIESCLFALIAWLIQDWRYMQLFCCILGVPYLLTCLIIPESFRWYLAHDRIDDASVVIVRVANFNKRPIPDLENIITSKPSTATDRKYTFIHLLKSKHLMKITLLLSVNWLALGLVYYGISFAIQALAGNIYLNMFLFSVVAIPAKLIAVWLQSRVGRRIAAVIGFIGAACSGFVVGIVQCVDSPQRDILTNVFAIIASTAINTAWGPILTMTIEMYPTVIRNIGFGSLSVVARFGAVLGPQFVYLNSYVPGLLYFVCGGIAVLCIITQLFLPETRNLNLDDKLDPEETEVFPCQENIKEEEMN